MQTTSQIWIVLFLVFTAVTSAVGAIGLQIDKRRRVQLRLVAEGESSVAEENGLGFWRRLIRRIDDRTLADGERRSKLRLELTQAGFFSPDAPKIYFIVQALGAVAAPWIAYLLFAAYAIDLGDLETLSFIAFACLGYTAPSLFVAHRRAVMATTYRGVFPDFLDLLVVCIDAGLSLNAALERVSREFAEQCPPLAASLAIFLSELRSGRSITDGLDNLSVRLGIPEARSLSTLIKQSMELGSDVGQALRVYADDMRVKRLMRAETLAAKLPVKMLLPIGLCIFPVILIVILTPALIKVFDVMHQASGG